MVIEDPLGNRGARLRLHLDKIQQLDGDPALGWRGRHAPDDQQVDEAHLGVCRRLRRFEECPVRRPAACATICPDATSARMGEVPADQRLLSRHERVRVPVAQGCDGGLRQVGPEWHAYGLGAHYRLGLRSSKRRVHQESC